MPQRFVHLVSIVTGNEASGKSRSRVLALQGGLFHSFGLVDDNEWNTLQEWLKYTRTDDEVTLCERNTLYLDAYHQHVNIRIQAVTADAEEIAVLVKFFADSELDDCEMLDKLLERGKYTSEVELHPATPQDATL